VYAAPDFPLQQGRFTTRAWRLWDSTGVRSPEHWASEGDNRVVLSAMTPGTACDYPPGVSVVEISMEAWESEATLFAGSGLSDLLGDPERAPLFPKAHYAAASIGYAAFAALAGFSSVSISGVGNPTVLAGGISEALITTAAGLSVAIPALIFHRYLSGRVDRIVLSMEEQALKMVEVMHGQREQ